MGFELLNYNGPIVLFIFQHGVTYEIVDRASIAMVWLPFGFASFCGPSDAFDWVIFSVLTAKLWCSGTWEEVVTDTDAILTKSNVLQEKERVM